MQRKDAARRAHGFRSAWLAPIGAAVLLAPNGMNRVVTPGASIDPMQLLARAALHITALPFGTHVAARCVGRDGRVSYVDADSHCRDGAARSEVFVLPHENVANGIPIEERLKLLHPAEQAASAAAPQCSALEDLVRVIDDEAQRPWPAARRDELRVMRGKAQDERLRLMCG